MISRKNYFDRILFTSVFLLIFNSITPGNHAQKRVFQKKCDGMIKIFVFRYKPAG